MQRSCAQASLTSLTMATPSNVCRVVATRAPWVFNAIKAKEVLTLNRDYFRLSKPYERRAYEIARKHCGRNKEWKIGLELLRKKMGATSPLKKFCFFSQGVGGKRPSTRLHGRIDRSRSSDIPKSRNVVENRRRRGRPAPPRALYRCLRTRQEVHRPRELLCMGTGLDSVLARFWLPYPQKRGCRLYRFL